MENTDDIFAIDASAKIKTYGKGDMVQLQGTENPKTFFVKSGLLRSYTIDHKAKQHIFMFAPENWIIADVESLEYSNPSELFIDCIEDSEIVSFNRDALLNGELNKGLVAKNIKLLYRRMGTLQRRIIMQMSSPAIDRYIYFLETYPNLSDRVPQHMIASYLGITPQALSKLRSELTKKS